MNAKLILLFLKGALIGFATLLPGISGGTMAFVLEVYRHLIDEIAKVTLQDFKLLFSSSSHKTRQKFKFIIGKYNWSFLLPLFFGMLFSVILFASLAPQWIEIYSFQFHALIFGLVLSSLYFPIRKIKWNPLSFLILLCSLCFSFCLFYFVDSSLDLTSILGERNFLLYLFAGFITASALIVPGISGAYLLILLGLYSHLLKALAGLDVFVIGFFLVGLIIGFSAMVRLMKQLFDNHFKKAQVIIIGFILGSLPYLLPFLQGNGFLNKQSGEFLVYSLVSGLFILGVGFFYKK